MSWAGAGTGRFRPWEHHSVWSRRTRQPPNSVGESGRGACGCHVECAGPAAARRRRMWSVHQPRTAAAVAPGTLDAGSYLGCTAAYAHHMHWMVPEAAAAAAEDVECAGPRAPDRQWRGVRSQLVEYPTSPGNTRQVARRRINNAFHCATGICCIAALCVRSCKFRYIVPHIPHICRAISCHQYYDVVYYVASRRVALRTRSSIRSR